MPRRYDLLIVIGLSLFQVTMVILGITGAMRVASGFLFVTLLPGYSLLATLYKPFRHDFHTLERIALAVSTSLALSAILSLLFNTIGLSMQPEVYAVWQSGLTCGLAVIGIIRDSESAHIDRQFAVIAGGILVISLMLGFVAQNLVLRSEDELISLYLLDAEGQTADYPVTAMSGVPLKVRIGVNYRGLMERQFQLVSPSSEQTPLILKAGATWEQSLEVRIPQPGLQQISWKLYSSEPNSVERSVHLWVQVQ